MNKQNTLFFAFALLLAACSESKREVVTDEGYYDELQEKLILAQPGDVIEIPAGQFEFDRPLSLDGIARVTLRGAGMDETILSFYGQKAGAEGLLLTDADSITVENLTIQDAKGDAVKLLDCNGVTLRNLRTTWSSGAKEENGAYGLYPVACSNVLIEGCEAYYASDAGIYVGQSRNIIVRNSLAYGNVAGIEIENSIHAMVHDNVAENNTGGILVFDLPDLPAGNGHTCQVYNNKILANNHKNFAPEGNIVGIVPPGTGIILLAAKDVEVFNNEIIGHKTIGLGIASYYLTETPWNSEEYDPYVRNVYVHGNTFQRKWAIPDLSKRFGQMVNYLFPGRPQDILYDGILEDGATGENPMQICIEQAEEKLRFANIDAANDFEQVTKDLGPYECALDFKGEISVDGE